MEILQGRVLEGEEGPLICAGLSLVWLASLALCSTLKRDPGRCCRLGDPNSASIQPPAPLPVSTTEAVEAETTCGQNDTLQVSEIQAEAL